MDNKNLETATLAGGCFWCTEAVFKRLKGVESVVPGYTGGQVENPSYKDICRGDTGHAEAIQIVFDPKVISYEELLEIFFYTHNPTTLNQQGADKGTQYRSAVFYHTDTQKEIALKVKNMVETNKVYDDAIVTEIVPAQVFYEAENYHHDYYDNNPTQGYCQIVIDPKIKKLIKDFSSSMK
jgi:peptide-methionine (S)-S-oxide reductase